MELEHKYEFIKIVVCIFLLGLSYLFTSYSIFLLVLCYIIISYEMYIDAFHDILKKDFFDENVLMILATLGAFYIGSNVEAVLVMVLYQIGELLSHLAVHRSKESITKMMDLRVDEVEVEDKGIIQIENVRKNDIFYVRPGNKIPLDGIVVEGESFLDTSSMTGESVPLRVQKNDSVLSGCINQESLLKIKATSTYQTSSTKQILNLIEQSGDRKTHTETFIHKFSKIYTPTVVVIALLLVMVPTLLGRDFSTWLYRALVFLVTSCPCALVISVPLGYFCGIGKASLEGIIIKGTRELEVCSDIKYIMFDKTGTITEGVFGVVKIKTKMPKEEFLKIIASAEKNSNHPIAKAILKKYHGDFYSISNDKEIAGKGISCKINHKLIMVGNEKLMQENDLSYEEVKDIGTILYVAIDHEYQGYLVISDRIRKNSYRLSNLFDQEIIILSGDNDLITNQVATSLNIKKSYGNLLPLDKVKIVKKYQKEGNVLFVGDGMNDAPVMKIADIGVSMGKAGSDATLEASDIIFMKDDLSKVKVLLDISKYTKRKVRESIIMALSVKLIVLLLAAFGYSTILLAVFADVGVTLLAILNVLTIFLKNKKA